MRDSVLEIIAQGAWNGGTVQDNSIFENRGMFFKGERPVDDRAIQERIGVRTRRAAQANEKIGVLAMSDLLTQPVVDPSRIKLLIGATNVGEDKHDRGPLVRDSYEMVRAACPEAMVFDLYAGCPGFNVAVEVILVLSLSGVLKKGDLSVIVGAENIHRAKPFKSLDTANVIFGDDALSTALQTMTNSSFGGRITFQERERFPFSDDFVGDIARALFRLGGARRLEGIIVDNQLGELLHRVPATAARVQHRLTEIMHPEELSRGTFTHFTDTLSFYDRKVKSFAFDIMGLSGDSWMAQSLAKAYIESGKHATMASVYLSHAGVEVALYSGESCSRPRPSHGIVDTHTRTHGCFASYIQAVPADGDVFGQMNGKGVFLYATRGARAHLFELLDRNHLSLDDIDLLVAHQANFAMIPITMERVMDKGQRNLRSAAMDFIARKMIMNIHTRGNCSVVSMQRLPYDLKRDALQEDTIQGYPVNRNLEGLKSAKTILFDSVGAGMTRSSFLQRV